MNKMLKIIFLIFASALAVFVLSKAKKCEAEEIE